MLSIWVVSMIGLVASTLTDTPTNKISGCEALEKKFTAKVWFPGSERYENETTIYWSKSVILQPGPLCVFTPFDAHDIATALPILHSNGSQFAVRGNGHMTVKGAASINNGILVALTDLRKLEISSDSEIASLGPGLTWFEVYNWVQKYDRVIVGARYAPVGVSGFLLGGGISFLGPQYGWGANSVVNFEVVTAKGDIIQANKTSNPDLFWALKGGGSNFGIVTRFDVQTHPTGQIYGGTISYDQSNVDVMFRALQAFAEPGGGIDNAKVGMLPNLFINPATGGQTAALSGFFDGPDGSALKNFTENFSGSTAKLRTYADFLGESAAAGGRGDFRGAFHCVSFKSSAQTVSLINDTVTREAVQHLGDVPGAVVSISPQFLGKQWFEAARESGGDAIDIDPTNANLLVLNLVTQWTNAEDDDKIADWVESVIEKMKKKASDLELNFSFIYLNDAQEGSDPFPLYGGGKSLSKLRDVRKRYDPDNIFQIQMPGGFKLGD
ncbi:FAD-binding domain-containing protein [Periconia macrospinosa]|uniref:FAD-binding domain-containing protein n=1 Tax=Periconia macrospinosa TaxID=97972 RepID=A0A2V1E019_9PLEO|nr:FAD-binding domain-containing protein [Periconia macrospinosa]